ncbi:hypothetical protein ACWN8P_12635 [Vagococcus salmoninarum]|uniref:Uncharacterized protein n=1 Tax=Vagococcus salmoninarum TaxID=2739 RepID=A0A429ZSD5_9ENTE|nr:hypothetical protein [Vagococcus salmoninarum]RST96636.1 hypothetical protein CBF35_05230 [Vagococcus salmoninarum]
MSVNVSLTQFTTFSTKINTGAKIAYVRKDIKNATDYHPAFDYWKALRDEIKRIHEHGLPIENLRYLVDLNQVDEKKLVNYRQAINTYIRFVNKHNVEYFQVGKSFWSLRGELHINTSPELGLIVDGQKYYVKNYYKKRNAVNKIDKRNIKSTLTLMQLSEKDFTADQSAKYAVLNFQNGKLIESGPIVSEDVLELETDAEFLLHIWNQV